MAVPTPDDSSGAGCDNDLGWKEAAVHGIEFGIGEQSLGLLCESARG